MEEIPGHPLDLSKLTTMDPRDWIVRPCGPDAVVIGAWMDDRGRLFKRLFRYAPLPEIAV